MDEVPVFILEEQYPLFVSSVKQFPNGEREMLADVSAAFLAFGLLHDGIIPTIGQLVAARDAAFRLCGVADGAGFGDVASFFYRSYESFCGQLSWYQG